MSKRKEAKVIDLDKRNKQKKTKEKQSLKSLQAEMKSIISKIEKNINCDEKEN